MVLAIVIAAITCAGLLATVCIFPQNKIGKTNISYYATVPFIGAVLAVVCGAVGIKDVAEYFTSYSQSNPVKILVLFISMSLISVYLDETGFFEYVAHLAVKRTGGRQTGIFISLFITTSLLTVVTSNDIVILTFTPFICRFCKRCRIDPVPYVFSQFVAANTFSLMFLIGNPTNIFLAQSVKIGFAEYLSVMWLPTIFAGIAAFAITYIIFYKSLKKPIDPIDEEYRIEELSYTVVGLVFLIACTLSIAILPYLGLEMYYVSALYCIGLFITVIIMRAVRRQRPKIVFKTLKRAPFEMIPLVLGMAVIALTLGKNGVTDLVCNALGEEYIILKYGVVSTLAANVFNNIPMSMIFAEIVGGLGGLNLQKAVYSSIIGSNLGAYLTPLGALAGLMFTTVLSRHGIKLSFKDFIKYGALVVPVTLAAALAGLYLVL